MSESKPGGIQFFIYDTIKIMVLLGVMIFIISYIQSYFPSERTKKILGRFQGIGANCIAALLGTELVTLQIFGKDGAFLYFMNAPPFCIQSIASICKDFNTVFL